jgi:hypothetical protein
MANVRLWATRSPTATLGSQGPHATSQGLHATSQGFYGCKPDHHRCGHPSQRLSGNPLRARSSGTCGSIPQGVEEHRIIVEGKMLDP